MTLGLHPGASLTGDAGLRLWPRPTRRRSAALRLEPNHGEHDDHPPPQRPHRPDHRRRRTERADPPSQSTGPTRWKAAPAPDAASIAVDRPSICRSSSRASRARRRIDASRARTTPIVPPPHPARAFVQSGFNEVRPRTRPHPRAADLTEASRFPNRSKFDPASRTRGGSPWRQRLGLEMTLMRTLGGR